MKIPTLKLIHICLLAAVAVVLAPSIKNSQSTKNLPVSCVAVIEESEERTPEVANIIGGKTARTLRDAGKWKLLDKDTVPPADQPLLEIAKSGQRPAGTWQSWLIILHEDKPTWNGPLPPTESEFVSRIKQEGGI